ncbi:MAG: hypothetical protein QOG01_3181 [Pseudonocardiales bacterium]|nr:hypothetical protein [Pseudonocardiales bacterium]
MIPGPEAATALLTPRTVAVVGDTPTAGRGGLLHEQLLRRGFTGALVPVNPNYDEIRGLPAFPTVSDYGAPVDFVAVTLGPARAVDCLRDSVRAGARAVLYIGSGFAEVGGEGAAIQRELVEIAAQHGVALAGPNCYGMANVRGQFAPFFGALPEPLVPGPVALLSGSGALTHAIGDVLAARGTGFGYVITVGNEAGVDTADYISLLADDPEIRVIACYLETLRDADRFAAAAEKAAAVGQQLVVLTVGRSDAARRASAAHTGALAGQARVLQAFLRELGAIVVRDLDELVEAVELASYVRRIGAGPIAVTTISGGGGAVLADLCADVGLPLTAFEEPVLAALRSAIPGGGTIGNPVDLTGLATDDDAILADSLRALDRAHGESTSGESAPDSGLLLFAVNTPLAAGEEDRELYRRLAATVVRVAPELNSPVALLTLTSGALDQKLVDLAHEAGIPVLQGARESLAAAARLRARLPVTGAVGRRSAAATTQRADAALRLLRRRAPGSSLTPGDAAEILRAAGVPVATGRVVAGAAEAIELAEQLGYPVVAKIESPDVLHKSDIGGVLLDLRTAEQVRVAAETIVALGVRLGARVQGIRIEKQVPEGVEVLLGVTVDPRIGPALVVGAGGIYTEVLDDAALMLAPATASSVRAGVATLRINQMLGGMRGQAPADVDSLVSTAVALSEFAWAARDELVAIDVNPVIVHAAGRGVTAVDAAVLTGPRASQSTAASPAGEEPT